MIKAYLRLFFERIYFEGYTYKEMCSMAGGSDDDNNDFGDGFGNSSTNSTDTEGAAVDMDGNVIGIGSGYNSSLNTSINPSTEYNMDEDLNVTSITTHNFENINGELAVTSYTDTLSAFDFKFDSLTTTFTTSGYTVTSGTIAAHAYAAGISSTTAHTIDAGLSLAAAIMLNSPIAALAPMAKAAHMQGLISEETSKAIQAAGLVGSLAKGALSTTQSISAVQSAYSMGAINAMQAAVLGAVMAYSMYDSFDNMQTSIASFGFSPSTTDMADFGFSVNGSDNGNGDVYLRGEKVTTSNFNTVTNAFILWLIDKNRFDIDVEFDTFGKMAGSLLLNNYLAGGDLWNPMNLIGGNYNNAVGIRSDLNWFAKISMMQEDYTGVVLAKNPM